MVIRNVPCLYSFLMRSIFLEGISSKLGLHFKLPPESSRNCFVTGRRRRGPRGPSKINVFAITWIRFMGFRQNLAWTYYLTLETSLRKNFSFFSKSKMAAGGQKFATRYTFQVMSDFIICRNGGCGHLGF